MSDDDQLLSMAENGRKAVIEKFNMNTLIGKMIGVYEEVIG